MSLETLISTVANQLAKQRRRSLDYSGLHAASSACMYRGQGGSMCALGAVIPDEYYSSYLEGHQLDGILWFLQTEDQDSDQQEMAAMRKMVEFLPSLAPEISRGDLFTILSQFQDFHDNDCDDNEVRAGERPWLDYILRTNVGASEEQLRDLIRTELTYIADNVLEKAPSGKS